MPHIRCTLPNASHEINGFAFVEDGDGVVSAESLPEEVAAAFLAIPGYGIAETPESPGSDEPSGTAEGAPAPVRRGPGRPPKTPKPDQES